MEKKINLLWTGGWDSTFRLLQLCELDVEIQPYYFIHQKRKSKEIEIKQMQRILEKIKHEKKFIARINKVIFVSVEDVLMNMKNKEITDSYKILKKKYKLGEQYEWFGLFCEYNKLCMELGIEDSPRDKMLKVIKNENVNLQDLENDFLKNRKSIKNEKSIFYPLGKNFIYAITDYSKKDMEELAKIKNWFEIMKLTWFCHNPVNNKPCGYCNPCRDAMALGMSWRMPFISKIRYYVMVPIIELKRKLSN